MRKLSHLIFISFLLISPLLRKGAGGEVSAQTNVYHPFPDTDAVWTVVDKMSHGGSHCDNISCDRSYIQTGKVVFNSVQYNALYLNEHCTETWIFSPSGTPCNYDYGIVTGTLVGGLRNDTAGKKVYYYDNTFNKECLIYDFSVNVGDSIQNRWTCLSNGTKYWKITSIDSVQVGASFRKRFNAGISAGNPMDTSIIEGIGSLTGLFGQYYFFENFNQLICFSVLGQPMYANPNTFQSCGVVGINEAEEKHVFSVSPNPTVGIFTVNSPEKFQYSVYDVLGTEIIHSDSEIGSVTLDLSAQPKGIYFVRGKLGDKVFSRKIILE